MTIKHVIELFVLDGPDFITEAYRNLLTREPDEHGLAYYMGRLAQGYGKDDVIAELAKSPECRPLDEIDGLKKLTVNAQRTRHWFWRIFARRGRLETAVYSGTTKLAQLYAELSRTNQRLAVLQDTIQIAAKDHAQQLGNLTQEIARIQIIPCEIDKLRDNSLRLSPDTVKQTFEDILGCVPENEEAINHYAKFESYSALREALMRSGEFQSKLAALSEYARSILQRQIQIATARCGE
ncbi:DUF4214 domain-containing protein [Acidithiobacillus thiooxidans]|uniref:DUF4214 domain-containing protein n=1 Tax=Acidithiobacillus thiooxidans TaxID=930 RepID=UPI002430DD5A|nr:DUF4214 domain-containing protein [Acidithiobacillus thiooxidans]